MRLRLAVCGAACLWLAACASQPSGPAPEVSVVVLPKPPKGQVGAVVVHPLRGGKPVVVDQAYVQASVDQGKTVQTSVVDARQVKKDFADALAALPSVPATYVVYFSEGTDELNPAASRIIDRALAEAAARPAADIVVIGHTDFLGSDAYNDRLSLQRAERVRDLLLERGASAKSIQVAGRGKREPLHPTPDNVAEPRNRRVEITVR